MAVQEEKNSS
jgi:hypothetical protein